MSAEDTIAAIATAPGEAGIGIVRLSGPQAVSVAMQCFRRADPGNLQPPTPRRAEYGYLQLSGAAGPLDTCVLTWFQAPRSYTGEEVVELACHGSNLVLGLLLRECVRLGARPAGPGEFTQRAFLNGRLDLASAEAVIDIIQARSEAGLRVAADQASGRLSRAIRAMRAELIALMAEMEVAIDFPDDYEPPTTEALCRRLNAPLARVMDLLATADAGRIYREGAVVVLAGRPNVGKSSLLNSLLGEERAIVTEVAGTTRDTLEESLQIGGVPVRAVDTAGLRETEDRVERLGVERTRRQLSAADLVLWILDASAGLTEADLAVRAAIGDLPFLLVANKIDLGVRSIPQEQAAIGISALTGEGMEDLREAIGNRLRAGVAPESVWVVRARHERQLRSAQVALERALAAVREGVDHAAVALDLRLAAEALGEITGETVAEETISEIFARFCVGK